MTETPRTEPAATDAPEDGADLVGGVAAQTTVAGVLEHVGDDATLAGAYLERERAAARPRSSLVAKLEQIAGVPAGATDQVEIELLGTSHNATPGTVITTDRERAEELRASGLARLVD